MTKGGVSAANTPADPPHGGGSVWVGRTFSAWERFLASLEITAEYSPCHRERSEISLSEL